MNMEEFSAPLRAGESMPAQAENQHQRAEGTASMPRRRRRGAPRYQVERIEMGKRIRKARRARDLTQVELAVEAGVSPAFLGHIERGSRGAELNTVFSICKALDVSMDAIVGLRPGPEAERD